MPGRHRSSRSRPIGEYRGWDSAAVVDADSSPQRGEKGEAATQACGKLAVLPARTGGLSLSLHRGGFGGGEAPRKRGGARRGRTSRGEEEGQFGDGGRRWAAGRGGRKAAGNLWFKESDPSCDMPAFNRRHLFVKSVPKDSSRWTLSRPLLLRENWPNVSRKSVKTLLRYADRFEFNSWNCQFNNSIIL